MLTVISPAKRLNETNPDLHGFTPTQPDFAKEANILAKVAQALTAEQLCKLMDISPALGQLNHDRFKAFRSDAPDKPAAFMFDGDTYVGLEVRKMGPDTLNWAQGHLRILSGLYGLLRPLDAIQPYRLEMGSKLTNAKGRDLYAFWGKKIALALNGLAKDQGTKHLINCASTEYFSAVDMNVLKLTTLTPVFLEERNGEAKIVSFWAKKARGAMARYISQHHLTNPNDLRGFDLGGYSHRPNQSNDTRLIFSRAAVQHV
jgi:cytoplasmic iron level regulating protein YaaA (DUF328/UPF0246 family)